MEYNSFLKEKVNYENFREMDRILEEHRVR